MQSAAQRHQIPMRGILYMLITSVVLFPALNASVKYLSQDYSLVQIIWMRSVVHFLWMVILFAPVLGINLFVTFFYNCEFFTVCNYNFLFFWILAFHE